MTNPRLSALLPPASSSERAKADFLDEIAQWMPTLLPAANHLLARVSSPNWALEWGLGHWISDAYGLDQRAAQGLLLSNVYLLAVARLTDDLADGETPEPLPNSVVLATSLQHLWIRQYVRLFDSGSLARFWPRFDDFMAQWMRATLPGPRPEVGDEADRGAVLRIACAAGCILAGRPDIVDTLVRALDKVLVGIVLLDDAFDWRADLAAGRHNALVAFSRGRSDGSHASSEVQSSAVVRELYLRNGAADYFALLREHLCDASSWARRAACPGLERFVSWYDAEVSQCAAWFRDRAHTAVCEWLRDVNASIQQCGEVTPSGTEGCGASRP